MFCRRCTHKFPFNRNGREMLLYYCLILLSLALVQTLRAKYKVIIQSTCGSFGLRSTMSSKAVILVFFLLFILLRKKETQKTKLGLWDDTWWRIDQLIRRASAICVRLSYAMLHRLTNPRVYFFPVLNFQYYPVQWRKMNEWAYSRKWSQCPFPSGNQWWTLISSDQP